MTEEKSTKAVVEPEVAYPSEQILSQSEALFQQPRWVVEGALSYANLAGQDMLKKSDVQKAVDGFMAQVDAGHKGG